MNRRRFLLITGGSATGILLAGSAFVALPKEMVLMMGGGCSFCGRHASATDVLAGVAGRPPRMCRDCLGLFLGGTTGRMTPPKIQVYREMLARGDVDGVIRGLVGAIEANPTDKGARLQLADLLVHRNRLEEGAREYELVAEAFAKEGFLLKAIAVTKQIQKFAADDAGIHFRLGDLYYGLGLHQDAGESYRRAFEISSDAGTIRLLARTFSVPGTPRDPEFWIALRAATGIHSSNLPEGCSFCERPSKDEQMRSNLFRVTGAASCRECAERASELLEAARNDHLLV